MPYQDPKELTNKGLLRQYVIMSKWANNPTFPLCIQRKEELGKEIKRRNLVLPGSRSLPTGSGDTQIVVRLGGSMPLSSLSS